MEYLDVKEPMPIEIGDFIGTMEDHPVTLVQKLTWVQKFGPKLKIRTYKIHNNRQSYSIFLESNLPFLIQKC